MKLSPKALNDAKELKALIFNFIRSSEFKKWSVIISRKAISLDAESGRGGNDWGETDLDKKQIILNPHRGNLIILVKTIIHELLHAVRPDVSEQIIRRWERTVFAVFSPLEITALLAIIFKKAVWNE